MRILSAGTASNCLLRNSKFKVKLSQTFKKTHRSQLCKRKVKRKRLVKQV